jgi:hypothetical protein
LELASERAPGREAPLLHDLEHWSQRQPVAGREEVDRRSHHRVGAHGLAIQEQPGQLFGSEAVEPRPESGVRIERFLCLERDEVLDRVLGRHFGAAKEELALEERTVQGTPAEHRRSGDVPPRRRHARNPIVRT